MTTLDPERIAWNAEGSAPGPATIELTLRVERSAWLRHPVVSARVPRSQLKAYAGFFESRATGTGTYSSKGTMRITGGAGLFLHLRWSGNDLLLIGHDGYGDAPRLGIKRYKSAPLDMPWVRVWSSELLPLVKELVELKHDA